MSSTLNDICKLFLDLQLHIDLTSHLELSSETVVFYSQFTHLVVHHSLDESLDTELEIAGSQ